MTKEIKTNGLPKGLLSAFMKKQISEKSSKNNLAKNSSAVIAKKSNAAEAKDKKDGQDNDEMSDEEKLEEAKKLSNSKASDYDQTEMFKKLIIENIIRYTALIGTLLVIAIGVIKLGPAFIDLVGSIIHSIFTFGIIK